MARLPVLVPVLLALLCGAASGSTVITVKPGEDVTLTCQSADVPIRVVEWTRPDLVKYVLSQSNGHPDPANQHSSFRGRVELVDKDLKTGDVSLILKNVSRNDEGTYECRVVAGGSSRRKRASNDFRTISTVRLQVSDSDGDQNRGTPHLYTGLGAAAGLVLVGLNFFLPGNLKPTRPAAVPSPVYQRDPNVITVKTGQDATLRCRSADVIRAVEWTRSDLHPEYVLFNTDGHSDTTYQQSSLSGRVQLVDKDLKTGNVSLILRNVNRNDSGTYECRVKAGGSSRQKRDIPDFRTISTFQLQVSDSDRHHLIIVLEVAAGLVVVVAVGIFAWKRKNQPEHRSEPSSEPLSPPAEDPQV